MTTVKELIRELEKMPKDLIVLLNNNTENDDVSVYFINIKVEEHKINFPTSESKSKQKFILLNQGGMI